MTRPSIRYQLDPQDRIQAVDTAWLAFARANAGPELDPDAVLGRRIWDFIAGKETRHLYRLLIDKARREWREMAVPLRCDSPTRRRYLELAIKPLADGVVEFSSSTIREEPRPFVALLDPSVARSDDLLVICSWCKHVRTRGNEWVEVERAIRRLDLFASDPLPQLTHGICSACEAEIESKIEL